MRIVGITFRENSHVGHATVLLQSTVPILDSSFRHVLPWFFCTTPPADNPLFDNPKAIRIQTDTDPFQHLRKRRVHPFDGKGFTIERHQGRPDVIQIDNDINVTLKQFQLLCPGLFYGTVKHPNLNVLLSAEIFRSYITDPVKLWRVMYHCLCCESFIDRQESDRKVKHTLSNNFYTTQLYDCRSKLVELQEHVASAAERNSLEKSLESMQQKLHTMEILRCNGNINDDTKVLQTILSQKREQIASKNSIETDIEFEMRAECSQQMILVLENELEDMLLVSEHELCQSQQDLAQSQKDKEFLGKIHALICRIQEIVGVLSASSSHAFAVEKARCIVENNRSLQTMVNMSSTEYKARYLNTLKEQRAATLARIEKVAHDIELGKEELSEINSRMEEMNDHINWWQQDEGRSLNELQKTFDSFLNATLKMAQLEEHILAEEKSAWLEYMHVISSVRYDEIISIAAALCAMDELPNTGFDGFVYERVLEVPGEKVWLDGYSCNAIFKSSNTVPHVEQVMILEHNIHTFHYNIMERDRRSATHAMLMKCVSQNENDLIQGGEPKPDYEELVTKVNVVVNHFKKSLKMKRELRVLREARKQHVSLMQQLLEDLHQTQIEAEELSILPNSTFNYLPKQMSNYTDIMNEHLKLQARKDSLDSFIQQLEDDSAPLDAERIAQDAVRLDGQFKDALKMHGLNRRKFYENLRELAASCDAIQTELERNQEHRWSRGLSLGTRSQLVKHWEARISSLNSTLGAMQEVSQQIASHFSEGSAEKLDDIEKEIQSLKAQEIIVRERIKTSQHTVAQYMEKYPSGLPQTRYTVPRHVSSDNSGNILLAKICEAQRKLQTMAPGRKPDEIVRLKKKIKLLQGLEKLQSSFRDMHLNNLILPTIDKLHVKKLQQIGRLVAAASEDLPELGGTVKVIFSYHTDGEELDDHDRRMSTRMASFKTSLIAAVNVTILDETGEELQTIDANQRDLAFLLLFISFLYIENCKLFLIDLSFQNLFDHGILSMRDVFKKHFPAMQTIILCNDA